MKKTNNKGFTLVELIVVLVILAILAAILVPALLGYIDKAREKQVTTNAEAAYVAAQALATEYYGKTATPTSDGRNAAVTATTIQGITDIQESFTVKVGYASHNYSKDGKKICRVNAFQYQDASGNVATWSNTDGSWDVKTPNDTGYAVISGGTSYTKPSGN